MAKYKVISENRIILADLSFMESHYNNNFEYVGEDDTIQEPATPPQTKLSKLQAMDRFTDEELAAIYTAAKTVVQVEVWLDKFKVAEFVDLADPKFQQGINSLATAGLLTAERAAEILTP